MLWLPCDCMIWYDVMETNDLLIQKYLVWNKKFVKLIILKFDMLENFEEKKYNGKTLIIKIENFMFIAKFLWSWFFYSNFNNYLIMSSESRGSWRLQSRFKLFFNLSPLM